MCLPEENKSCKVRRKQNSSEEMVRLGRLWMSLLPFGFLLFFSSAFIRVPGALAWSKEGHVMTCQIAQVKFKPCKPHFANTNYHFIIKLENY